MKKYIFLLVAVILLVVLVVSYGVKQRRQTKITNTNPPAESPLPSTLPTDLTYATTSITHSDGKTFSFLLPVGYGIIPVQEGLRRARFMATSPDGRLFVTDMKTLADNSEGKIYILSNFNPQSKKFSSFVTYLDNLRNPHSLAFYTDKNGQEWIYIALTDKLIRYKYTRGENTPSSEPLILTTFPDYGLSSKEGGWHLTRTILIRDNKVYVSVGSSCNACEEKETVRASILEMNPDGSDQKIVANGLRNAVGMSFKGDTLYAAAMGVDHLGKDKPDEALYAIEPGTNYGWPYCYEYQKNIYKDVSQQWKRPFDCSTVPHAEATFPAHAAPLGVQYFDKESSPELRNTFLVALHGSGNRTLKQGYKIVRVDSNNHVSDFITGFFNEPTANGRPVGILQYTDSSFFFTDDLGGVLYYVYKK